jgi:inhibitor of KinA
MPVSYNIYTLGDQGFTIELGKMIDEAINQRCLSLAQHIKASAITAIKDVIPAYTTVSVIYDARMVHDTFHTTSPSAYMYKRIQELVDTCQWQSPNEIRNITIPACFDTTFGPDLQHMCDTKKIAAPAIIEKFVAPVYRVYMIGFLPGFAYMGKIDDELAMPRKEKPHANIPAGSIGIAGQQTGIYPLSSPGGWNIIGRTPMKMFDMNAAEPCLLKAGDHVQFLPISKEEFDGLNQQP